MSVGPQDAQPVHGVEPGRLVLVDDALGAPPLLVGPPDDLVLYIGDVGDVVDVEPVEEQVAPEHVVHQVEPPVADMGEVVHRRTADIHRHFARRRAARRGERCRWRCRGGAASGYGNPIMPTDATDARPAPRIPAKPTIDGVEATWVDAWEDERTYRFDDSAPRERVFSIDTPPPTVSGSLHMGSVFGYVQTDALARYRRMTRVGALLPDGLGRQRACPPSAGCRPTSGCAATPRCPTTRTSSRRTSRGRMTSRSAGPISSPCAIS